jgi:hypothetical protein
MPTVPNPRHEESLLLRYAVGDLADADLVAWVDRTPDWPRTLPARLEGGPLDGRTIDVPAKHHSLTALTFFALPADNPDDIVRVRPGPHPPRPLAGWHVYRGTVDSRRFKHLTRADAPAETWWERP